MASTDDPSRSGDRVVGIDWASRGWLCVGHTRTPDGEQAWEASMEPSMHAACQSYADATTILVDVPIGLPATADRACDRDAKALLGGRASSVFWTPCRRAVYADTYETATAVNEATLDRGLSSQAWGVIPRIREVDMLLQHDGAVRDRVRESHPEVAFRTLNRDEPIAGSKHTDGGRTNRIDVLETALSDSGVRTAYNRIVETYIDDPDPWQRRIGASNRDDLVDAFGLAVTARLGVDEGFDRLPRDGEVPADETGLPMEIVYTER